MAHLWKLVAKRNNGTVLKGMSAEILKSGTSVKPSQNEIAEALSDKYGKNIHYSHVVQLDFDFEDLNQ